MDKLLEILGKNNFSVVNTGSDLKIFLEENIEEYIKQISSGCDDMVNRIYNSSNRREILS